MIAYYIDSSAAIKLLVAEQESKALQKFISSSGATFVSSACIDIELTRSVTRNSPKSLKAAQKLLDTIQKVDISMDIIKSASLLLPESKLRSLDAIHLATFNKLSQAFVGMITYDAVLVSCCKQLGLNVFAPGKTI